MSLSELRGKNILLTGASRGLGRVCALALAEMGACLFLTARDENALQQVRAACSDTEGRHGIMGGDLLVQSDIQRVVSGALSFFGDEIHVVLHVAGGGLGLRDDLLDATGMGRLFALNVGAVAEINRLVVPAMRRNGGGHLVHVGSIAGTDAVASVGYNTAKAALSAYVRSLGRRLASDHVVVTGVLPGGFSAPGNSWERLAEEKPDVVASFVRDRLPRGHLGRAEELVPLIAYLCSDAASMMGGCMVPIDAGEGVSYA